MQTAEKIGLGVAGVAILGLMAVLVITSPDVPDAPAGSASDGGPVASAGARMQTISQGDSVAIDGYLRPGVRTVVEFTADW